MLLALMYHLQLCICADYEKKNVVEQRRSGWTLACLPEEAAKFDKTGATSLVVMGITHPIFGRSFGRFNLELTGEFIFWGTFEDHN